MRPVASPSCAGLYISRPSWRLSLLCGSYLCLPSSQLLLFAATVFASSTAPAGKYPFPTCSPLLNHHFPFVLLCLLFVESSRLLAGRPSSRSSWHSPPKANLEPLRLEGLFLVNLILILSSIPPSLQSHTECRAEMAWFLPRGNWHA